MNISAHLQRIVVISVAYVLFMILVKIAVVPIQTLYFPAITPFAALLFPLHGIRVIAAWLYGIHSVWYLLTANFVMHLLLTPDAELNVKSLYSWGLVSSVAWFTLELMSRVGFDVSSNETEIRKSTWRKLVFVGFVSSIFNSIGHNVLFSGDILPEDSFSTLISYLIGDTLGTIFCLFCLMLFLKTVIRRGA